MAQQPRNLPPPDRPTKDRPPPDRPPKDRPPNDRPPGGFGRVLRWLVPALVLAAVVFFGLRALPSADLSNGEMASLTALTLILASLLLGSGSWGGFGKVIKAVLLWAVVGAVLLVGYTFRDELGFVKDRVFAELDPAAARSTGDNEITVRAGPNGHFYLRAEVNGQTVRMLVDTGATYVSLSRADAERIGIKMDQLKFDRVVNTANGQVRAAPVTIPHMRIGTATLEKVRAHVSSAKNEGDISLFGLSGLRQFRSYEVKDGALILRR